MTVLHGFEGWPRGPIHLAIGVFDGVHLGHQELVRQLCARARASAASAVAATFDPLPIQVLAPGTPPSALSDAADRVALLGRAGADAVAVFRYDPAFAAMSAREFVGRVRGAGDVRRVVIGPDFRFGHGREGDVALLAELGRRHGFGVEVVAPVEIGGSVVSSTRIRELVRAGDVDGAGQLLGRPYPVRGRIVGVGRRGHGLGYATIDVVTPSERLLPRDGTYATWVTVGGGTHAAATSVGARRSPDAGRRVLESHLIDVRGDFDGEEAMTAFVRPVRDVEEARAALGQR